MENGIPHKWKSKESWCSNTHIRQNKSDFKIKTVTRDKKGYYIMIKGSIQEEDIAIVNIYASNIGAHQYIRQILTTHKRRKQQNTHPSQVYMEQWNILQDRSHAGPQSKPQ